MKYSLKELRARNKMTQEDLAKATGISKGSIVAYELKKLKPTVYYALKIAEVLGVKVEEIDW